MYVSKNLMRQEILKKKIGKFWELNKAFVPLRICKSILPNSLIKIRSKAISYNTIFSIHNFFYFHHCSNCFKFETIIL